MPSIIADVGAQSLSSLSSRLPDLGAELAATSPSDGWHSQIVVLEPRGFDGVISSSCGPHFRLPGRLDSLTVRCEVT